MKFKNLKAVMFVKALPMAYLSALLIGSANAATVTDYVTFTASNFSVFNGSSSVPTDPVTGSFTITFDPTQTYNDSTQGITLNSLNIVLGSALSFAYSPTGPFPDLLIVGGVSAGADGLQLGNPTTDDFAVLINNFTTAPSFNSVGYVQVASGFADFYTRSGSVSVNPTPLPAALPLFATGATAIGLLGWRRKRKLQTSVL